MKILYIANVRMPTEKAHGIQIIKMCEAFSRLGHEVELFVPWRFNHIKEDPFQYYSVEKNFTITKIPSIDLVMFGRVGFLIQSLSFAQFASLYVLAKHADIIYSRDELPLWYLIPFKKNLVWEAHMPRKNIFARILARHIKRVVVISNGLRDFFISNGTPPARILVAHDGVDLTDFMVKVDKKAIRKKLGIPLDRPIAMYIGRLDRWKGAETLLKAGGLLQDVQVVIAGEGSLLKEFEGRYPDAIFTGPLPYRNLPYNQQAADVLIIPNSGGSEVSSLYTSPLKVFAHMASGVPIVASDLPSIREVLNEQNAILVEADSRESFAEGIKRVLLERDKSTLRGSQAILDVNQYTWDKRATMIMSFCEKH